MNLNKKLHLGLILILIICSIAYAYELNWDSILDGSISFSELKRFSTSVFVLTVMILGYYYKPKDAE